MGLNNEHTESSGQGHGLSIIGGQWRIRVEEGTPGAVSRKLTKGKNEGKEVWEVGYDSVDGYITSAKLVKSEHFKGLNAEVEVTDFKTGEKFSLSMPADSKYFKSFMKCLPNWNPLEETKFELCMCKGKTATGGNKYYMKITQGGSVVKDHYVEWKKDASGGNVCIVLNGMPDKEEALDGADYTKQDRWLWEQFNTYFDSFVSPNADISRQAPTDQVTNAVTDAGELAEEAPADFEDGDTGIPF